MISDMYLGVIIKQTKNCNYNYNQWLKLTTGGFLTVTPILLNNMHNRKQGIYFSKSFTVMEL